MRSNIATFLVTVTLIALIGEGVIRIICAVRPQYDIEMLRYALELKSPQWTAQSDGKTVLTFRHKPNTTIALMGVDVTTNSMGLRSANFSPSSWPRVLVLGDSITMGWGVPQSSVLDRVAEDELRRQYPKLEIVNAGIGNYNAASMSYLYHDLSRSSHFDTIAMYLAVNDIEPDPTVLDKYLIKRSRLAALISIRWSYFRLRFSGNRDLYDYYSKMLSESDGSWRHNLSEIRAIQKTAHDHNQNFVVVLQPDLVDFGSDRRLLEVLDAIGTTLRSSGIAVYNVYDGLPDEYRHRESRKLWVAPDDRHYNAIGHRFMGLQLAAILAPLLGQSQISGTPQ